MLAARTEDRLLRLTSVLYSPMMDSTKALSNESLTLPTEASTLVAHALIRMTGAGFGFK